MAKVTGPLLSIAAGGAIAKTQVYSKWRGIPLVRRYVVPANPKSEGQQHTRGVFAWLNGVWKQMDPALQAVWTAWSKGRAEYNRNGFLKFNTGPLRDTGTNYATDATGFIASPGVNAGLAAGAITSASGGAGALAVTLAAPTLPDGWAIVKAHCIAFIDAAAWNNTDFTTYYQSDATDPYVPTFAGLPTGTYDAFAFFEYTKPDGSTAYSPSKFVQQAVA